jgi:hypothetical protein
VRALAKQLPIGCDPRADIQVLGQLARRDVISQTRSVARGDISQLINLSSARPRLTTGSTDTSEGVVDDQASDTTILGSEVAVFSCSMRDSQGSYIAVPDCYYVSMKQKHMGLMLATRALNVTEATIVIPALSADLANRVQGELARAYEDHERRGPGTRFIVLPDRRNAAERARFNAVLGDVVAHAEQHGVAPYKLVSLVFGISESGAHQLLRASRTGLPANAPKVKR